MQNEELEWELYDIFESGLFAFPIYEHNGARRIVQYLLYRGVPDEEIADAIEDSTQGLWIWLHRHGKNMVGEWVIMWINEMRDEWKAERARERKERRERRRLLGLSHEISPNRETTTTFGSGDFGSGGDLDGSNFELWDIHASDLELTAGSGAPRPRRKKKVPEPSAPDENLLLEREKACSTTQSSRQSSPRSPRSLRIQSSLSDVALHDIDRRKSTWDQCNMAGIRHVDSSLSTIHSENDQEESIGDILTKTSVTVIIEHVNDSDELKLKDGHNDSESKTSTDNQKNNEDGDKAKVQDSDSDKENDMEKIHTKRKDSESENDKEDTASGGKHDDEQTDEKLDYVVVKRRRKNEDENGEKDQVVVIEKTVEENGDVSKTKSEIISEKTSDYIKPGDFSIDGKESRDSTVDQSEPSRLREHREVKMHLVLEGYYHYGQDNGLGADGSQSEHSDNVHDSGINTPDLTNETDQLSPAEKDFFLNKDGEFDDTFSEIFYDAENDFETSSKVPLPSTDDSQDQFPTISETAIETTDIVQQTTLKMSISQEENNDPRLHTTKNIANEIEANMENDRRLVATLLNQNRYADITEPTTTSDDNSNTLSICNDCSLTTQKKPKRCFPKRRSRDCSDIGLPVCARCKCTIAHYSYQSKPKPHEYTSYSLSSYCDVVFCDSALKAMEFNIDTLDKEGPGYIFVMTEALGHKQLPWSTEQRYRIASSRQPDRWILEFKSRNIQVDVVWQIRVQNHIRAVREVHRSLQQYNLHTNWFRCSLAVIIENVLNIASKYRVIKERKY